MPKVSRTEETVTTYQNVPDPVPPTPPDSYTTQTETVTTDPYGQRVDTVTTDPYAARRVGLYRAQNVLYTILSLIEGLLIIRFVLKLLAANPAAGFVSFIYGITAPLVAPFYGIFPTPAASNGSVMELFTIVALIVYPLVFWLFVRLLWLLFYDNRTATVTRQVESRRIDPPL